MNKARQRPFAAIVRTHFDEALGADGCSVIFCHFQTLSILRELPRGFSSGCVSKGFQRYQTGTLDIVCCFFPMASSTRPYADANDCTPST